MVKTPIVYLSRQVYRENISSFDTTYLEALKTHIIIYS